MKHQLSALLLLAGILTSNASNMNNLNTNTSIASVEGLTLTQEWDKVFPKSEKVDHKKVTFVNRYGITVGAG